MKADQKQITRLLKTARGQIDGILKMVEEDRYCIDISHQLMACEAVLKKANKEIFIPEWEWQIEKSFFYAILFPNGNDIQEYFEVSKEKLQSAEAIGALIRTTRKAQGLSQAELAGVANTGVRFISDLENGKGTIQLRKLLNVLNALGLGLYIFNRWENE